MNKMSSSYDEFLWILGVWIFFSTHKNHPKSRNPRRQVWPILQVPATRALRLLAWPERSCFFTAKPRNTDQNPKEIGPWPILDFTPTKRCCLIFQVTEIYRAFGLEFFTHCHLRRYLCSVLYPPATAQNYWDVRYRPILLHHGNVKKLQYKNWLFNFKLIFTQNIQQVVLLGMFGSNCGRQKLHQMGGGFSFQNPARSSHAVRENTDRPNQGLPRFGFAAFQVQGNTQKQTKLERLKTRHSVKWPCYINIMRKWWWSGGFSPNLSTTPKAGAPGSSFIEEIGFCMASKPPSARCIFFQKL